jgi:hypothetical protein
MRLAWLLPLLLAAAGCRSSMQDVYDAKTEGRSAVYPVAEKKAVEVSGDVIWETMRAYPENHPGKHFVCATGGMGSDQTLVGVWCEPQEDAGRTRVTVVVRRASGMQVDTLLTEEEFHDRFARGAGVKRLP